MNGQQVTLFARWVAVALAALGLAYGYGVLNNRVATLEVRSGDNRVLIVTMAELSARMVSLEKEVERVRLTLERSQNGAMYPQGPQ